MYTYDMNLPHNTANATTVKYFSQSQTWQDIVAVVEMFHENDDPDVSFVTHLTFTSKVVLEPSTNSCETHQHEKKLSKAQQTKSNEEKRKKHNTAIKESFANQQEFHMSMKTTGQ